MATETVNPWMDLNDLPTDLSNVEYLAPLRYKSRRMPTHEIYDARGKPAMVCDAPVAWRWKTERKEK